MNANDLVPMLIDIKEDVARQGEKIESIDRKTDELKKSIDTIGNNKKWYQSTITKLIALIVAATIGGTTVSAFVSPDKQPTAQHEVATPKQ